MDWFPLKLGNLIFKIYFFQISPNFSTVYVVIIFIFPILFLQYMDWESSVYFIFGFKSFGLIKLLQFDNRDISTSFIFWVLFLDKFSPFFGMDTNIFDIAALIWEYSEIPGTDPGFQVRGAHLSKLRRAEGGAEIVGVFRVKNHDFTPKNYIFSNFRGGGGGAGCAPHWIRPWIQFLLSNKKLYITVYLNTVFKIKNVFIPNISYSSQSTW